MSKVSRKEADILREKVPEAHIAVVNRQHRSKEKTYYAEENRQTIPLICKMRDIPVPQQYQRNSAPAWKQRRQPRNDRW